MTPDEELVERLRAGDEAAFAELVNRYHRLMLRVARMYVRTNAVAEEVVQESWLAVVLGIQCWHHTYLQDDLCELPKWRVPGGSVRD